MKKISEQEKEIHLDKRRLSPEVKRLLDVKMEQSGGEKGIFDRYGNFVFPTKQKSVDRTSISVGYIECCEG